MLKTKKEIGKTIKDYRTKQKLTQTEFAELLNVSKSAVSNWENGETFIDLEVLEKLATMMKVSLDNLIRERDIPSEYKIYDTIDFGSMIMSFERLQPSKIKFRLKNKNDFTLSLSTFRYQLRGPNGEVFKESTDVIPGYDEWEDDIVTTEKLSNVPSFISSNDEVVIELIFNGNMIHTKEYILTILFNSTEIKLQIPKAILKWEKLRHDIVRRPESLKAEELKEIIQFNKATEQHNENISLLKAKKESMTFEDLKEFDITDDKFYIENLYMKLDDETRYKLLNEKVTSTIMFQNLSDVEQLNSLYVKHRDALKKLLIDNPKQATMLHHHLYKVLSEENRQDYYKLLSEIPYTDETDREGLNLFDAYLHRFIRSNKVENIYELMRNYSTHLGYTELKYLFATYNNSELLDLMSKKTITLSTQNSLILLNNHYRKDDVSEPICKLLLKYITISSKEEYETLKGSINSSELLELLLKSKIIDYSYLV